MRFFRGVLLPVRFAAASVIFVFVFVFAFLFEKSVAVCVSGSGHDGSCDAGMAYYPELPRAMHVRIR